MCTWYISKHLERSCPLTSSMGPTTPIEAIDELDEDNIICVVACNNGPKL